MKITRVGTDLPKPVLGLTKTITFTGGAGLGAIGQVTVFTISGPIHVVKLIPTCSVNLASAGGTVSLGRAGSVAQLIAATTATALDAGMIWTTSSPGSGFGTTPALLINSNYGTHITMDVLIADITAGALDFYLEYIQITPAGASVT